MNRPIILGITGASGALYSLKFLEIMAETGVEVHGIVSEAGQQVLRLELGDRVEQLRGLAAAWHEVNDLAAPMSSGSSRFAAMVVLPCTMGTLAAVANGLTVNLIHRAAAVTLKERRPLLLAVRETPFSRPHLQNMLQAHDAGATICPAMPSFYTRPESLEEMARFLAGRLADLLGLEVPDQKRWQGL